MQATILVTGATGTVGSSVAGALAARGVRVRAFARAGGGARQGPAHDLDPGLEIVAGDFADAASLRRAVDGVDAMFLASPNHPRQVEFECAAIDAALAAGVRRIVKLSALGAEIGSGVAFWDAHGRIERHLRATRVPAVVLQPTIYMTNVLAAVDSVRHQGRIFAPAGRALMAMIDPHDVAAAAVAALTSEPFRPGTYELTGPEAIGYERVASELSTAVGRTVEYVHVADDTARAALAADGMPSWFAENVVAVFTALRGGAAERVTPGVERLTGRPPRSFAEFARRHAALFAATPTAPLLARAAR